MICAYYFCCCTPLLQPNRIFRSGNIFPSIHTERSIKYQFIPSVSIFFFLLLLSIFLFHFGRPLRLYALQQHEATTIHIKHFTKHAFNNQSTNVIQGFDTMLRLALIPVNLNVVALSFPFSSFCVPFFCFESLLEIYPIHLTTRAKHYKSNFLNMNRIVPAPISQWFFFFLSFGALIISTQSPTYNDIHNFHSATIYVFCGALYS